jgi:hypothetical protein
MEVRKVVRRRGSEIFLDSRLTDGGEVVAHTRCLPFTPRKIHGTVKPRFVVFVGRVLKKKDRCGKTIDAGPI